MIVDNESHGIDERKLAETIYGPVCRFCKHFSIKGSIDSGFPVCDAFPDGIPVEIWKGDNNHTKPYPGDHGIQFEQSYAAE